MLRTIVIADALILFSLCAQSSSRLSFEVASVKPADPSQKRSSRTLASGDRVSYANASLSTLLGAAYSVTTGYQVEGPAWIRAQRYDVVAKAPDNTPKDQIPLMLQSLLADRFKLKIHRETRDLPVYQLIFVKASPRLQKVDGDPLGIPELSPDGLRRFQRTSMDQLTRYYLQMLGRPVLNKTSLTGAYNFPLELSIEEMGGVNAAANTTQHPSIFTSIEELGLKLESAKAPFEMVIVDGGNPVPTEN